MELMQLGKLYFDAVAEHPDLLAKSTGQVIGRLTNVWVSGIDPSLSDTAAFCEHYAIGLAVAANCVVVEAKRADQVWYGACVVLATSRIDVNGIVRRHLEARKISFAPMDMAVSLTEMEYGGITPIGLPEAWPILVDTAVAQSEQVIIGSGVRRSKLLVPGQVLATLPNAIVLDIVKPA